MSIGSFFGKLFGTDKAISGIVESARDGIDALVYTDEEKANDAAKDRAEARKMVVEWMAATQGQNLARRLIALSITGIWLGMYLLSAVSGMVAIFVNDSGAVTAEKINAVGELAKSSAMDMNPAVMLILAFYFAAPHMGDFAKAITGRFTQSMRKG